MFHLFFCFRVTSLMNVDLMYQLKIAPGTLELKLLKKNNIGLMHWKP